MRNYYKKILPLVFFSVAHLMVFSQTITFNTQTMGSGFTGNNGSSGISFVVQNTNTFPAVLTSVSNYFAAGGTGNFTLWYSATSLSGGPIALTSPTWSPIQSVTGVVCGGGVQTTLFPLLAFTIPASTTYRFYIEETSGPTFTYTGLTNPTGVSPLIFTTSGVNLIVGESLILGQFVGWGGLINNPRSFTGAITLNLLSSPCTGTPVAGTATALPNNPCPGIPVTLALAGTTAASGIAFQWQRAPSPTGPWTTGGLTTATTNPSYYTPPPGTTSWYRCIVTCTNSGLTNTSTVTGAVAVQSWSATGSCWCVPTYSFGGTGDNITNVTLGTLSNNTTAAGNPSPFWVDYSPLQTGTSPTLSIPTLFAGLAATLTVSYGTDPNQYGAMWIDYNHSGAFEPSEYVSPGTNAGASGTHVINFTPPGASLPGITRMRIRGGDDVQMNSNQACGPTNSGWGETEDYLVNIIPAGPYDPAITAISAPVGNLCPDSNQTINVVVCNYGSTNINLALHPTTVTLTVNGPGGPVIYLTTLNTGNLSPFGAGCSVVTFNPVNMFMGGFYSINAYVSCPSLTNGTTLNDTLSAPITIMNYRPTAGADYPLCQFNSIPFGQGLTVGGCTAPLYDSVTINFTITGPCIDNVGATALGTSTGPPSNCSDQYACAFANGVIPNLPPGSSFYTNAVLSVTNMHTIVTTSWASEVRMNLYGATPTGTNLYAPGQTGNALGAPSANFTYSRQVPASQVSSIFSALPAGGTLNMGYWESWNDDAFAMDAGINAGSPSVATLKIYYQYVPPSFAWYDVPAGGASLYSLSPFDPLSYPNAVVNNSNVSGLYTFYAACLGLPSCRVPVNLKINPTPSACQDTVIGCEYAIGANNAIFDLDTVKNHVSCFNSLASVEFYGDQALLLSILNSSNDTSSTNFIYSKVFYPLTGCYSSDSLYLQVSSIPQFSLPVYLGPVACTPNSIDISSIISVFPPIGNDTSYYHNPAYTVPYIGNPHAIFTVDTLYMIVKTNNTAACADSAVAYINVLPATNYIANEDISGYFSIPGTVGCGTISLTNGTTATLYTTTDCRKVATVTDSPLDLINLGNVSICEEIDATVDTLNGQPYVARHYEITPTTNGKAQVCLYYLQQDFLDYNATAFPNWPDMNPNLNLCITQVDNGDITTPGHTAISIPNSSITSTYDPSTFVWTVCFPVDSFSYFYCATCNPLNTPLPVNLLSFTGKRVNETSELNWVTSSEQNSNYFIVERSKDSKTFSAISPKINSKAPGGNSSVELNYGYTDMTPLNGHNYYRLQEVDIDGRTSYSGTVDVYFGNETMVTLYPNPVTNELNVDINTPKATVAYVKIMDATGRVVRTIEMTLQAGSNSNKVDLHSLADGMYMVSITNNKGLNYTQTIRKK